MTEQQRNWLVIGLVLASGLLAEVARGAEASDRIQVPEPNLEKVEVAIAEQLRALRRSLDEALRAEPHDPAMLLAAYAELGRSYLAYGMLDPGVAALENAIRLDDADYRWPYLVARVAQENNELDRAAVLLARVLELEADYLPALIRLGDLELSRQALEPARQWYEKALTVAPGSPAANYGLGSIAVSEGRPEEAVRHFQEVLEVQPSATAVHYSLGLAFRDLGQMEKAREHLAQRGEVSVRSHDPLANALGERVVGAGLFLNRGNVAFRRGNYELAIQAYTKAVAAAPGHRLATQGLASSYSRAGRLDDAIKLYEEILAQTPDDAVALYNLGTLLSDVGRRLEAKQALERAVAIAPDFDDALFNLALMHEQDGSWQEALELYEIILAADPADLDTLVHRASALAGVGRTAEARAQLDAVLERDPRLGAAYWALAELLRRVGNAEDAASAYRAAIDNAVDARSAGRAAFQLASMLALSDPTAAIEAFKTATVIAPEVSVGHFALARLLAQEGRYAEAAVEFDEGLALEPEAVEAHVGRAIALLLADQEGQALDALDASLTTLGDNSTLAHLRARLLAASSDPAVRDGAAALAAAQQIMQREPGLEHAETVAMALAEVGQFEAAVSLQGQIRERAQASGLDQLLPAIERRLAAYRAGEPIRAPWKQ